MLAVRPQERAMTHPIAEPLVENAISSDLEALVGFESDPRGVVTLTINGVGPSNALNGEVAAALKEAFETLHGADSVRLVLLRGAGGAFSSGLDRDWLRAAAEDWGDDEMRDDALIFAGMMQALAHIPALTVAVVEGAASGAGAGLAAGCDMALAASDARFAFPEVKMGAVAAVMAPAVVEAVGARRARALLVTGAELDAAEALRIGLVDAVVEGPDLAAAVERLANQVLPNGLGAMAAAKQLVGEIAGRPIDRALMEDMARRQARVAFGEEGREGRLATLEGRQPGWATS
jgi:methylglutaconyl-CoA hydratase